MLIFDTNHFSEITRGSNIGRELMQRVRESGRPVATTIITIEEQLRGWFAQIRRARDVSKAVPYYTKVQEILDLTAEWTVLPWDENAATTFKRLSRHQTGIGTMDLKIAAIALANSATLLSRNLRDFARVPGLTVEDWLQ